MTQHLHMFLTVSREDGVEKIKNIQPITHSKKNELSTVQDELILGMRVIMLPSFKECVL